MKTSQRGIDLIKQFEKFSATMYLDPVGLPTIGYGTLIDTAREKYLLTVTISEIEAVALLQAELAYMEPRITKLLQKSVTQNQFDALSSFCYNLGTGALRRSTLLKKLNINPDDPTIRNEFNKWIHAGGMILTGLVRRRKAEADLYFNDLDMT